MKPLLNILAATLLLTACIDTSRSSKTTQINTTLGQEILDLKKALDQGAIDEREYRRMIEALAEERLDTSLETAEEGGGDS